MIDDTDADIAMMSRSVQAEQRAAERLHTELELKVAAKQAERDRRYLKISLSITAVLVLAIVALARVFLHV